MPAGIPDRQIRPVSLTGPYAIEKSPQFRKLLATGTDAAIGPATSMASAVVVRELHALREPKAEFDARGLVAEDEAATARPAGRDRSGIGGGYRGPVRSLKIRRHRLRREV